MLSVVTGELAEVTYWFLAPFTVHSDFFVRMVCTHKCLWSIIMGGSNVFMLSPTGAPGVHSFETFIAKTGFTVKTTLGGVEGG